MPFVDPTCKNIHDKNPTVVTLKFQILDAGGAKLLKHAVVKAALPLFALRLNLGNVTYKT